MKISARFEVAISTTRPRGARVIESFSPKLGQRLQCFGEDVFRQWIRLESDPLVESFCERPTYLTSGNDKRLADFWIVRQNQEMLLVLDDTIHASPITLDDAEWTVRTIRPIELVADRVWTGNWERMLPVLISCRSQVASSLQKSILKFIAVPTPLVQIEKEFATGDPTLVRAAVFSLLHQGHLQAPQLQTESLSYLTLFQHPGRAGL